MRKTIKRTSVIGLTLGVAMGAGVAIAAWTATGTGDADVTATSAQDLVVTSDSVTGLYPTGSEDVVVNVSNPNGYNVTVTDITPGPLSTTAVDCDATSVLVSSLTGQTTEILAGGAEDFTLQATMPNAGADDDCQGATFTFEVTADGASS